MLLLIVYKIISYAFAMFCLPRVLNVLAYGITRKLDLVAETNFQYFGYCLAIANAIVVMHRFGL